MSDGWLAAYAIERSSVLTPKEPIWWRLDVSIALGALLGLTYSAIDGYLDHTIGPRVSVPPRAIEVLHTIIDMFLPTFTGALLGVAVHTVRLRARVAEMQRQRADALSFDLHKIERDQAVWVTSASLLHELRNPLHALGLLLDEVIELQETEPAQRRRLLDRARAQIDRIAGELATLRALPASSKPDLPKVYIGEAIEEVLLAVRETAPWAGVHGPAHDGNIQALVNPAYLRIILENLLSNALDSTKELSSEPSPSGQADAVPEINVSLRTESGRCVVEVSDNGRGVSESMRPHLFEPLRTSKPDGMGLGLPISRALARAMGGDLSLSHAPGGATFRLELRVP
jgi:C4-dicarboxylate-specific signal transduction histidine kinase